MSTPYNKAANALLFFHLVDATDGLSAETGITGTPQISVNGAAWSSTGVSALTEIGNGAYYATVDLDNANLGGTGSAASAGDRVVGRFKDAATAEAPSLNEIHAVEFDPDSDIDNLIDRLGSFTGSGTNTVLGFLRAIMRSDSALTPTDVGGTYDNETDALEEQKAEHDSSQGSGFVSATHSLKALYDLLVSAGVSVSVTSTLNEKGTMSRIVAGVRKVVDEGAINSKYTNADIHSLICDAWAQMWIDLNLTSSTPTLCRMNLTIPANTFDVRLPPNIGEIRRLAKLSTNGIGTFEYLAESGSYRSPLGFTVRVEGTNLRITPTVDEAVTLQLDYIPGGSVCPIEVKVLDTKFDFTDTTAPTIDLRGCTEVLGSVETKENGYAGYLCRKLTEVDGDSTERSDFYEEEALVESYDRATRTLTLQHAFNQQPTSGNLTTLELVPLTDRALVRLLTLCTSRMILTNEGESRKLRDVSDQYAESSRNFTLALVNRDSSRAGHFESGNISPYGGVIG